MPRTAKLFLNASQAVRLPSEFRFQGKEVFIRQDAATGEVILSERPESWDGFFKLRAMTDIPDRFMAENRGDSPRRNGNSSDASPLLPAGHQHGDLPLEGLPVQRLIVA